MTVLASCLSLYYTLWGCRSAGGGNSQEIRKTLPHPHRIAPQIVASMSSLCQKTSGNFPQLDKSTDLDSTDVKWLELLWRVQCDLRQVASPLWAVVFHLWNEKLGLTISKGFSGFNVLRVCDSSKRKSNRMATRQASVGPGPTPCCQGA